MKQAAVFMKKSMAVQTFHTGEGLHGLKNVRQDE
jgi:hypothetical protein